LKQKLSRFSKSIPFSIASSRTFSIIFAQLGDTENEMPGPNKKKAADARKKQKELEEEEKLLEAKIALLEGANSVVKQGLSPTEQALATTSIKHAHVKNGQKGRKPTNSEQSI